MARRKKFTQYKVRTSKGVALEMCRYEGGKIVSELDVSDPVRMEKWVSRFGEEEANRHRIYDFVIESDYCVVDRWHSFEVRPTNIHEVYHE